MKQVRRWQRNVILSLLIVSVLAPIVLLSNRLRTLTSYGGYEFVDDLSGFAYENDHFRLKAIEMVADEGLKEPALVVFRDRDSAAVAHNISHNQTHEYKSSSNVEGKADLIKRNDERINEMKDELIRAKAYLSFAPPNSNSHLVKELKLRIKDVERAVRYATKDSDLSRSSLQKKRLMESTLSKARHVYSNCGAMAARLRAMTYNTEEQLQAQQSQATYLLQLASRTTSKSHHCLDMRLTYEYFSLQPEERNFPSTDKLHDPELHHFVVFSDNVLACAVVVNSTMSAATEPEKIVFHIITDSLNLPAISMWFLLNHPAKAVIDIQSISNLPWLPDEFDSILKKQQTKDPRYNSLLNHLRFYLPDIFPALKKIVFLDHDVVINKDLTRLWDIDMKGRVIGAVETCDEGTHSYHRIDMFVNFSDQMVADIFDPNTCTWAFGLNLFDLEKWRYHSLTARYHKYLKLGIERGLWKAGSLPLGWVVFYDQHVALERKWLALGLGYESGVGKVEIERAAVIHFDGIMKPWLEIGISKYKSYWSKHLRYDHPFLQQCNIHE